MESKIYNQKGKEAGTITLPESVFGLPWNADLVHQVVTSMESSARTPVAHAKNRGEVSGGGKKPWQQKGTGRARHGSIRSPLWVGGGVTHGPRKDENFFRKVNKKMKTKALFTLLSAKLKKGQLIFIEDLSFKAPKTAEAKVVLSSLSAVSGFSDILSKKKNSALVALFEKNPSTEKSFSNFGNIMADEVRNMNPLDVLKYKYLIITDPKESIKFLEGKLEKKTKVNK